jgi:SNF2 family DNA or RNA helicase
MQAADPEDVPICGAVPASIAQYLRPYQRQGVEFLWRCATPLYCIVERRVVQQGIAPDQSIASLTFSSMDDALLSRQYCAGRGALLADDM